MKWRGKEFKTYTEMIDQGLSLTGDDQNDFVETVARSGPYALQNIGYFSGYYAQAKADKIMEVFKTAHPIFGRRHPGSEEAFEMGKKIGEGKLGK